MDLSGTTTRGRGLIALAESLADDAAKRAAACDRAAAYPFESLEAVKQSGYLTAPIPRRLGGLGVTSGHDVLVPSGRLARGDASLALGVNMHLLYVLNVVRRYDIAVATGKERRVTAFGQTLETIVREGVVFAAAGSEIGQDLTRPATRATRSGDGWVVSGRKAFCTMAPAADVLYTAVSFADEEGRERYGYAMVPKDRAGVVVHDDWDALGMRASGSHSVTFDDVELPADALRGGFPAGDAVQYMERNLSAGLFHASAMLGVAESAHTLGVAKLAGKPASGSSRAALLAADNTVDLNACRAVLSHA